MFQSWLEALEQRHLADLRFPEVTRALRALSADYVQRRDRLRHGALEGRGKRAAFALFYGPLHYLLVERIAREVFAGVRLDHVTDLGCGTGAAGAALAVVNGARSVTGIDRQGWALDEAAWTYRHFGLRYRTVRRDLLGARAEWARPSRPTRRVADKADPTQANALVAAFTINELTDEERAALLPILRELARAGAAVLIVEPIARGPAPWWHDWARAFLREGGRADEWRFSGKLPERVRALDRAAGLDHREQTARSLSICLL